jgi:hypothetical protein
MKKTGWFLALLLVASGAWAQGGLADDAGTNATTFPIERMKAPTYADQYCAGFITKELLPNANYVGGGLHSPSTTKYTIGDIVFLTGSGYQPGQQLEVVRELRDPNRFELFDGQQKMIRAAGHPYSELGRVRVLDTRNKTAIARVEYSCEPMVPGDSLIPFSEKPQITLREPGRLDRFMPANGKPMGRIIMARDFDSQLGWGGKVYINVGSNQGVKVGDYFRAVRPYSNDLKDPVDSLSFKASTVEDTQRRPASLEAGMFTKEGSGPVVHVRDFPRRAVGEMVVLSVTPTTSTAMVVFAVEDVHAGDFAEVE